MATNISIPSWAPPGENHADLFIERTSLSGAVLGGIGYGVFVCLYFITMHDQLKALRRKWWQIAYLNTLFIVSTVYLASATKWAQQMFIDYRNFHLDNTTTDPTMTGPLGFYNLAYNTPMIVLGNSFYILLNVLSDGLVLYRCLLIWNMNFKIMILPALMFVAEILCGIITVWNNSLPNSHFFVGTARKLITAWIVLSMTLNILLCLMITFRIRSTRARLTSAYGAAHARRFTSVGAIAIESALSYAFVSLLTLIFYELPPADVATTFVNILLPLLSQTMCIAPTLILLRVARQQAFTRAAALASVTGTATELVDRVPEGDRESRASGTQDLKHA